MKTTTNKRGNEMKTIHDQTRAALADGKIIGDGHTIFKPEFYAPHFSEDELRKAGLVQTFKSDTSSSKSTIFDTKTGSPIASLSGVYNLSFLEWLARKNGITNYAQCHGRGSQAQVIAQAISAALKESENI